MPRPRPSPAATIRVMEMIPHAMPNIVSSVRRLCAHSVASVSRNRSRNVMGASLLQDHLLFLVQPGGHFRLHAVRYPDLDGDLLLAVVGLRIRDLHGRFAVLV